VRTSGLREVVEIDDCRFHMRTTQASIPHAWFSRARDSYQQRVHQRFICWRSSSSSWEAAGRRFTTSFSSSFKSFHPFMVDVPQFGHVCSLVIITTRSVQSFDRSEKRTLLHLEPERKAQSACFGYRYKKCQFTTVDSSCNLSIARGAHITLTR